MKRVSGNRTIPDEKIYGFVLLDLRQNRGTPDAPVTDRVLGWVWGTVLRGITWKTKSS